MYRYRVDPAVAWQSENQKLPDFLKVDVIVDLKRQCRKAGDATEHRMTTRGAPLPVFQALLEVNHQGLEAYYCILDMLSWLTVISLAKGLDTVESRVSQLCVIETFIMTLPNYLISDIINEEFGHHTFRYGQPQHNFLRRMLVEIFNPF